MQRTRLPLTDRNLVRLVIRFGSKETLDMIKTGVNECKTKTELVEWVMECFYTFPQNWIIVKIVDLKIWGLIRETEEADNEEYLSLLNSGKIKNWHE